MQMRCFSSCLSPNQSVIANKKAVYIFACIVLPLVWAGCSQVNLWEELQTALHSGQSASQSSAAPELTGTVSVIIPDGGPMIDAVLTADTSKLDGEGALTYQWKRGESANEINEDIPGATDKQYTLTDYDDRQYIAVTVTREGYTGSVTSTTVVGPVGLPPLNVSVVITGEAVVGKILTATVSGADSSEDFNYQWKRNGEPIPNANKSTYTLAAADVGCFITVSVELPTKYSGSAPSENVGPVEVAPIEGFVWIRSGEFTMGSPTDDWYANVTPHQVILTKGFYMGKYQVTQKLYQTVMVSNPSYFSTANSRDPAAGEAADKRPVETVSWYDALVFCNKMSELGNLIPVYSIGGSTDAVTSGTPPQNSNTTWNVTINTNANGYRLPTEAEWEYACRAGTTTAYNLGDTWSGDWGWCKSNSNDMTHEVGKTTANGWGLFDMHGNVSEWCWDRFDANYYTSNTVSDPTGPATGTSRIYRGGSFGDDAKDLRSAYRNNINPWSKNYNIGFRLVRNL